MASPAAAPQSQRPAGTTNAPVEGVEAPPQEQPQGVGAAVAAAVAAALATGAVPKPPTPDAVKLASAQLLAAMDQLFRDRRVTFNQRIVAAAEAQMPGIAPERVQLLAAEEMARESEFQRKVRMRLEKDLPVALREVDPGVRAEAVGAILNREKRYLAQREQAAAQRLVSALEADLLKQVSPQGAYWQLSPFVREHCLRCLAMAGKFWPWEVLDTYRIPMHPNCACRLLSADEAISNGLLHPGELPDKSESIAHAKMLMDQASRLEESLTHEEQQLLVTQLDLHVAEASLREFLRWGSGTSHGGQFRPSAGGDPGSTSHTLEKMRETLRVGTPRGRTVSLLGKDTFIPHEPHWEQTHGKHVYTSPAGSTHVYRDGKLLDTTTGRPGGTRPKWDWHSTAPVEPAYSFTPDPIARNENEPQLAIPDYSTTKLTMGKRAGGSTGAQWAFDEKGDRWLVKSYKGNSDRVASELLANAIYRDLGAHVAPAGTYRGKDNKGRPVTALAYPTLPGETRTIHEPSRELGRHFMADALVANWDFIGLTDDNVLWGPDGKPARLDQGGTFQFRAQGAPKPYGPVPTEAWTMLGHGGQGFDKVDVTEGHMRRQAAQIAEALPPARVHELVHGAPWQSTRMRGEVERSLNDRVQWMKDFANGDETLPRALAGSQIATHMREAQGKLEPAPEHLAAVQKFVGDDALRTRMQAAIRKGSKLSPTLNSMRQGMDALIKRQRAPQDLTVYRPVNPENLGPLDQLKGKVLHDKGFGTATSSRANARDAPGMIQLHVPAGAPVLHAHSLEGVGPTTDEQAETELMLPRGARMRVRRVEQRAGRTIVHAVML